MYRKLSSFYKINSLADANVYMVQCGSGTVKRKGRDLIAMATHRHSVLGLFWRFSGDLGAWRLVGK